MWLGTVWKIESRLTTTSERNIYLIPLSDPWRTFKTLYTVIGGRTEENLPYERPPFPANQM